MGFMAWGLSDWWLNLRKKDRLVFLLTSFTLLFIGNFSFIGFSERGAELLWFPVFLALYLKPSRNKILYSVSGILLLISNKASTAIAFFSILFSRFKAYMFGILFFIAAGLGYAVKDLLPDFFSASVNSRISIWQSSVQGFLASPIYGHGFKTFVLDYPEYKIRGEEWGTLLVQQIAHGHSLFFHYLFEFGLIGALLLIIFFYLIYKRAPKAILPLLIVSCFDVPITLYSEFLLASLILAPFFQKKAANENTSIKVLCAQIPKKYSIIFIILAYSLALYSLIPSFVGHFYYDQKNYTQAIKWDKENSLYYLVRGVERLSTDRYQASSEDFKKAISLTPGVGYIYGYLAAAQLALHDNESAKKNIDKAMKLYGINAYWEFIAALANYEDEELFNIYFWRAMKSRTDLIKEVRNPDKQAGVYIGSKESDVRVLSFYRQGPRLFLPLPYIPDCPDKPWILRKRLLEEAKLKKKSKSQAES